MTVIALTEEMGSLATDVARLEEAYRFSGAAHAGQIRQSGEPYVSHPLAVAEILAGWHLDGQALVAAMLGDPAAPANRSAWETLGRFERPRVDGQGRLAG